MRNFKIKPIINLILFLCSLAALILAFSFINKNFSASAMSLTESTVTLEHDFEKNSVIVILDEKISKINKEHKASFFEGIDVDYIEDLTKRDTVIASNKEIFRQILQIFLKNSSKEKVLYSVEKLNNMEGIYAAEPNYAVKSATVPNDPYYSNGNLWGLTGNYGIDAPNAWNITTGNSAIRVGIIDSGIASHPDLNANLVSGYDSYNKNSTTNDITSSHGTHVAGTIGAVGNNGVGIAGINWNVSLVPLQASNPTNGLFSLKEVIGAIEWASQRWGTNDQIDIINYSVSGFGESISVREAVRNYKGLFVWAAGNQDSDVDTKIQANGSFDLPNLISVGALKQNGNRPSVSDWGFFENQPQGSNYSSSGKNVNIYAPGDEIYSTVSYNTFGYASYSGTSMAAPHVTGVAALILSKKPALTGAALKEIILNSADDIIIWIPNGTQKIKKLNAFAALQAIDCDILISLDHNGGSSGTHYFHNNSENYPYITHPSRADYVFTGYFDAPIGGTCYYYPYGEDEGYWDSYLYDLESDITLYAQWDTIPPWTIQVKLVTPYPAYEPIDILEVRYNENVVYSVPIVENCAYLGWELVGRNTIASGSSEDRWPVLTNLYEDYNDYYTLYLYYEYGEDDFSNPCIATGTLITLADGTQKAVEDLTGNEMLLVWNLYTGSYDSAPILFIDNHGEAIYEVINLSFSDGTVVKMIGEHGFWDVTLNQYVYLGNDAAEYIGHWFNKQNFSGGSAWTNVQLTDVTFTYELTTAWSPVTHEHLCYYVNGMLSMPGGIDGLFNIFEVDEQTMKYDEEAMQSDIETYGLFTYEDFEGLISEEIFEAVNAQYLKVAIGKGLLTWENIEYLISRYANMLP